MAQLTIIESLAFSALLAQPAWAEVEDLVYNPQGGDDFIKNVTGIFYIGLVGIFLFRLLKKRAAGAKSQKIAGQASEGPSVFDQLRERLGANVPAGKATAVSAMLGALQAGALAFGLFIFSSKLQANLDGQTLPDGYTARNISITVRTILSGLSYLATFIFGANAVGLLGLSGQLFLFPNSLDDDVSTGPQLPQGPQLPKISITAKPEEVRRAFEQAERMGRTRKPSAEGSSSSSSSSSSGSSNGAVVDDSA